MKYEGSGDEVNMLMEMGIDDALKKLLEYENVFGYEHDMIVYKETNAGPAFFAGIIKNGTRIFADFNQHRVRLFEDESGKNFKIRLG